MTGQISAYTRSSGRQGAVYRTALQINITFVRPGEMITMFQSTIYCKCMRLNNVDLGKNIQTVYTASVPTPPTHPESETNMGRQ